MVISTKAKRREKSVPVYLTIYRFLADARNDCQLSTFFLLKFPTQKTQISFQTEAVNDIEAEHACIVAQPGLWNRGLVPDE